MYSTAGIQGLHRHKKAIRCSQPASYQYATECHCTAGDPSFGPPTLGKEQICFCSQGKILWMTGPFVKQDFEISTKDLILDKQPEAAQGQPDLLNLQ